MMKLIKWNKTDEQIRWGRGLSSINVLIYFGMANCFWHSYRAHLVLTRRGSSGLHAADSRSVFVFFWFLWDVHVSPPHFHSSVAFPRWLAADVVMNKQIGGRRFIPWSQKNHHVRTRTSCSAMMPRPSSRCLASLSQSAAIWRRVWLNWNFKGPISRPITSAEAVGFARLSVGGASPLFSGQKTCPSTSILLPVTIA